MLSSEKLERGNEVTERLDHDADRQSQRHKAEKTVYPFVPFCLCAFVFHISCFSPQPFILLIKSVSTTYGMTSRYLALVMAT